MQVDGSSMFRGSIVALALIAIAAASPVCALTVSNVAVSADIIRPHMGESTSILYSLDQAAKVTVRVRNASNVVIRTFCDMADQIAGQHSISWDGKDSAGVIVTPEVYEIRIVASVVGQVARSSASVMIQRPSEEPSVGILDQSMAVGTAFPGSAVDIRLNGSSIGTATADLMGRFSAPIASVQTSNTLIAIATNPITGEQLTSGEYVFPGITSVSISPNPFDPALSQAATISYTLPVEMTVSVLIIDSSNQPTTVGRLVNEIVQAAGQHSVDWDGKNSQGIFQCSGRHLVMISGTPSTGNPTLVVSEVRSPGPQISDTQIASATASSFTVTWTTDVSADSQVEYGLDTDLGSSTPVDANMVTAHSVTVSGLTAGEQYYFRVVSTDGSGHKSVSGRNVAEASVLPASPTNLQATPIFQGIALSWTGGGSATRSYRIYRGNTLGFPSDDAHLLDSVDTTTYVDRTVVTGTTYYYRICGRNYNELLTDPTSTISAAPLSPPTSVAFLEVENAGASATWTGNWSTVSDSKASGGAYKRSDGGTNAAGEFAVAGPEFILAFVATPDGGLADIYVDGYKLGWQLDCNSGSAGNSYTRTYAIRGYPNSSHAIRVQYAGPGGGQPANTYLNLDVLQRRIY